MTSMVCFHLCSGVDPTTVAVFMEDGGALIGLMIAGELSRPVAYTGHSEQAFMAWVGPFSGSLWGLEPDTLPAIFP